MTTRPQYSDSQMDKLLNLSLWGRVLCKKVCEKLLFRDKHLPILCGSHTNHLLDAALQRTYIT